MAVGIHRNWQPCTLPAVNAIRDHGDFRRMRKPAAGMGNRYMIDGLSTLTWYGLEGAGQSLKSHFKRCVQ